MKRIRNTAFILIILIIRQIIGKSHTKILAFFVVEPLRVWGRVLDLKPQDFFLLKGETHWALLDISTLPHYYIFNLSKFFSLFILHYIHTYRQFHKTLPKSGLKMDFGKVL